MDPIYQEIAQATGGKICYEKDTAKCITVFNHHENKKNLRSNIRSRFSEIKMVIFTNAILIAIIAYVLILVSFFNKISANPFVASLIFLIPSSCFWIIIGGFNAILWPENFGRIGFVIHIPLVAGLIASFLIYLTVNNDGFMKNSKLQRVLTLTGFLSLGLIPIGFIYLISGMC